MSSNLFAPPPGSGNLSAASQWLVELVNGQAVTTIAVIAVAFLGYETLSGRMSFRNALRVVVGCFMLLGAATIARGFMDASRETFDGPIQAAPYVSAPGPAPAYPRPGAPVRANGNPFDPYASERPPN